MKTKSKMGLLALLAATIAVALVTGGCAGKATGMTLSEANAYDSVNKHENVAKRKDTAGNEWFMSTAAAMPTQSTLTSEAVDIQTTGPVVGLSVGPWRILSAQDVSVQGFQTFDAEGRVTSSIASIEAKASTVNASLDAQASAVVAAVAGLGREQALVEVEKLKAQGKISGDVANLASSIITRMVNPASP